MRKTLTAALAALTFGAAVAATAAPAQARPYGYYGDRYYGGQYYRHRHHDNDAGVAIAAGVVGLALGAAIASSSNDRGYYDRGYYGRPYYDRGYYRPYHGYGYGYPSYYGGYGGYYEPYRVCTSKRWVYDPYIGRDVKIRSRYAC